MPDAVGRFPSEKLKYYPHMFPLDIGIWERFLDNFGSDYKAFDYDVKVGKGSEIPPGTPESYARMQEILSKYRIDAVGYDGSSIYIIEVKPEASTVAIGQIVSYVTLYQRDFNPSLPVKGMIVTDREIPDIRHLTEEMGILYYIV